MCRRDAGNLVTREMRDADLYEAPDDGDEEQVPRNHHRAEAAEWQRELASVLPENAAEHHQSIAETHIASYMVKNPISISERCEANQAVALILDSGLKRIPVVTEERLVVGTLNRVDVFQALFDAVKL